MNEVLGFKSFIIAYNTLCTPALWARTVIEGTTSPEAECKRDADKHPLKPEGPGRGCWCGFHGTSDIISALASLKFVISPRGSAVLNIVRAEGQIIIHTRGFRAQFFEVVGVVDVLPQHASLVDKTTDAIWGDTPISGTWMGPPLPTLEAFERGQEYMERHYEELPVFSVGEARRLVESSFLNLAVEEETPKHNWPINPY